MYLGDKYLRLQTTTTHKMDKVDKKNIEGLIDDGKRIITDQGTELKAFMKRVILAKYGKTQQATL